MGAEELVTAFSMRLWPSSSVRSAAETDAGTAVCSGVGFVQATQHGKYNTAAAVNRAMMEIFFIIK